MPCPYNVDEIVTMKKPKHNQRGAALILVIAAITFLTMLSLDMFDDSLVNHQLALNYRSRVQSYYLAKSAFNFSKMLLYYNKKVESSLSKKSTSLADLGYEPLYKMIPLSSEALRAMVAMGQMGAQTEDEDAVDEDTMDESEEEEVAASGVSMLEQEDVEEFLGFEGDFDSEISEEQSKYSVNAISKMTSTSSSYDMQKKVLYSLLMAPEFKTFFENQRSDAEDLVHAISDFVDSNSAINEFDGVERGNEVSLYGGDVPYSVKNSALLTLSELRLVSGMGDDIYETLKPLVTVYHTSDKVNICLADSETVDALIAHFTKYAECTSPLDEEDDAEEITEIRDDILSSCPSKTDVAIALNLKLGLTSASDVSASSTSTTSTSTTTTTSSTSSSSSKVTGCAIQFEDLLSEDNDIFEIKARGNVGNVETIINIILDASSSQAKKWSILYYQVN